MYNLSQTLQAARLIFMQFAYVVISHSLYLWPGLSIHNLLMLFMRVLQKVLSLGSDYFSAMFYQTYFYYKPSKYSPFNEIHFYNLFTQSRKAESLLLVSVGDTDK